MSSRIGLSIVQASEKSCSSRSYPKNLILGLAAIDRHNKYFIFLNEKLEYEFRMENPNFVTVPLKVPDTSNIKRIFWEQFSFPQILDEYKLDLMHCLLGNVAPIFWRGNLVHNVHDIPVLNFPSCYPRSKYLYLKYMIPQSLKRAKHIITKSESAKSEIVDYFGIGENRITIVYDTFSDDFISKPQGTRDVRDLYGIGKKYILRVGALEPIKNAKTVVDAFALIKDEPAMTDYSLVIAGPKGWHYQDVFDSVKKNGLEGKVIFTGYIPDEDVWELYENADLFVSLSLYEGFGLPYLEAIFHGLPVIASNRGALPEVVGEGGILVDPCDAQQVAKEILSVLTDSRKREALKIRAKEQAKKFLGNKMAEQTLNVYKMVLNGDAKKE